MKYSHFYQGRFDIYQPKQKIKFLNLKLFILQRIANKHPVVLNMSIGRPHNYKGSLVLFDSKDKGFFCFNELWSHPLKNNTNETLMCSKSYYRRHFK